MTKYLCKTLTKTEDNILKRIIEVVCGFFSSMFLNKMILEIVSKLSFQESYELQNENLVFLYGLTTYPNSNTETVTHVI